MQIGWLFKMTKTGKKYGQLCDYVHEVADDLIKKRRIGLVCVYSCTPRITPYRNGNVTKF